MHLGPEKPQQNIKKIILELPSSNHLDVSLGLEQFEQQHPIDSSILLFDGQTSGSVRSITL